MKLSSSRFDGLAASARLHVSDRIKIIMYLWIQSNSLFGLTLIGLFDGWETILSIFI